MARQKVNELLESFNKHSFERNHNQRKELIEKSFLKIENEVIAGKDLQKPGIIKLKEYLMCHD